MIYITRILYIYMWSRKLQAKRNPDVSGVSTRTRLFFYTNFMSRTRRLRRSYYILRRSVAGTIFSASHVKRYVIILWGTSMVSARGEMMDTALGPGVAYSPAREINIYHKSDDAKHQSSAKTRIIYITYIFPADSVCMTFGY